MEKAKFVYEVDTLKDSSFGVADDFKININLENLNDEEKLIRLIAQSMRFISLLGYNYPTIKNGFDTYYEVLLEELGEVPPKEEPKEVVGFKTEDE